MHLSDIVATAAMVKVIVMCDLYVWWRHYIACWGMHSHCIMRGDTLSNSLSDLVVKSTYHICYEALPFTLGRLFFFFLPIFMLLDINFASGTKTKIQLIWVRCATFRIQKLILYMLLSTNKYNIVSIAAVYQER